MPFTPDDQAREDRDKAFADISTRSFGGVGGRDLPPFGFAAFRGGGDDSSEKQRIALAEQQAALTRTSFSRRAAQDVAAREKVARDAGPQKPADRGFLSGSFPGIEAAFEASKTGGLKDIAKAYFGPEEVAGLIPGAMTMGLFPLMQSGMITVAELLGGMMPFGKQDPLGDPYNPYTTKGVQVPGADPGVLGSLTWEQNAKLFGGGGEEEDRQDNFLSTLYPLPTATPLTAAQVAPVSPTSVALEGLPGSAPLASLNPFLSPTNPSNVLVSQTDPSDVLVAYDENLGTVQPTFAHDGGAVMPGLGFRPLGYAEGDLVDEAWSNFDAVTKGEFTKEEMAEYLYNNLPQLEKAVAGNPARRRMLEGVKRWSGFDAYMKSIMPPLEESPLPAPLPGPADPPGNLGRMAGPPVPRPSDRDLVMAGTGDRLAGEFLGNLGRTAGSSVPRPSDRDLVMAGTGGRLAGESLGNLGRKEMREIEKALWNPIGSVSRPSDRDLTPNEYGPMGYAHGGYASRGTVAGELPRYGNMSVREEGETMGELSKRHRDQDWHSRMSGGLGSLGPRRRVA